MPNNNALAQTPTPPTVLASAAVDDLATYPIPEGIPTSKRYDVKVRTPGGRWHEVSCYQVEVDLHDPKPSSMAYFDFAGEVEVAVTYRGEAIRSARIRPLSYQLTPLVDGQTITFRLRQPRSISIEVNGDLFDNLHLFAGPMLTDVPSPDGPRVMFFGPGVHEPGERIHVPSNTTVFLAGGAVLKSALCCERVENVRICGRGVLYRPGRGVEVTFSKQVEIDGITVVNPTHYTVFGGQSQGLVIRNLKSFSSAKWSDGIDLMSTSDVLIDRVFLRTSDDCVAIYGHRWEYFGNARNIVVQNSTLWADVAHAVMVGTHGNPAAPEAIQGIRIRNVDILNHDEPQIDYQGCIALNASDGNLIRDVRIEDVRVEDFERGQLLNFRVTFNRKYATAPGRGIEDVYVKDLTYTGSHSELSIIAGYDGSNGIRNVTFENLTINGRVIWDEMPNKPRHFKTSDMARFFIGEYVDGIHFIHSTEAPTDIADP